MPETFVLFEVAGATYAVRSEQVQWIELAQSITRVPNAPEFVEGVTAIRGQVVPVVSMRGRFHMEPAPTSLRTRLIVIHLDERPIALLVDSAREFVRITPDQVKPPPETLDGPMVPYLDGVVNLPNRLVLIVNFQRLFSSGEREELTEPGSGEMQS